MWKATGLLLGISLLAGSGAAAAQNERIYVNSRDWEADSRAGITRLIGDVHIRQGNTQVWADNGVVHGTPNQPERLELEGSPCRWQGELEDGSPIEGTSDRIEFEINTNVLRFFGNVRFEGPQGVFTGAVLTYDMNTGQLAGRGEGEDGRASFVIEPGAIPAPREDAQDD